MDGGEEAWVFAFSPTGGWRGTDIKKSGDSVTYLIEGLISTDDYIVGLHSPRFQGIFYDRVTNESDAVKVDASNDVTGIDFTLSSGRSISGSVLDDSGNPVEEAFVEACSEQTGSRNWGQTDSSGNFKIEGLTSADDFIIQVCKSLLGCFFYSSNGVVRDQSQADEIDVATNNVENLELIITTGDLKTISGKVTDMQDQPLKKFRVSAWSEKLFAGGDAFTDTDGKYIISGLSEGYEYVVRAEPPPESKYLSQKQTNVSTDSANIDFMLKEKNSCYSLTGIVIDSESNFEANARVIIKSATENFKGHAETGQDGKYQIDCIPGADDYELYIQPGSLSDSAMYKETSLNIQTDINNKDIQLNDGRTISGTVTDADDNAISGTMVVSVSNNENFVGKSTTNKNGHYEITNLPALDKDNNTLVYEVKIYKAGYVSTRQEISFPGSGVLDFTFYLSGCITGRITSSSSGPVISAIVETASESMGGQSGFMGKTTTDNSGQYSICGLRKKFNSGDIVADYSVSVKAVDFPSQTKTGRLTGDNVEFTMSWSTDNQITGEVKYQNNAIDLNTYDIFVNFFEENGDKVARVKVELDTASTVFDCRELTASKKYNLQFMGYDQSGNLKWNEWADASGNGIADPGGTTPVGAHAYATANTVNFQFSNPPANLRPLSARGDTATLVQSLASTTHVHYCVKNCTATPQGRSSNAASNNAEITVQWETSSAGTSEAYYHVFNTEETYEITKRNISAPSSDVVSATSQRLSGDNTTYYFHIAVEDDRGRIQETSTVGFVIDTVAPQNTSGKATRDNNTATTKNVNLELGADNASDMCISNVNYGEGCDWENFSNAKQWKVSSLDSPAIYVQFRDDAGNTGNTLISKLEEDEDSSDASLQWVILGLRILAGINVDDYTSYIENINTYTADGQGTKISLEDVVAQLVKLAEIE